MNLELSAEQDAMRATVRSFLADHAGAEEHARSAADPDHAGSSGIWRGLADLGTTGLLVEERLGGAGLTMVEAGMVLEELGAVLHPGPWTSCAVLSVRLLDQLLEPPAELYAGIADGTLIVTSALEAPGVSLDSHTGTTLSGELHHVPDASTANLLLIPIIAEQDFRVFAVEAEHRHLHTERVPGIDHTRRRYHVKLDGVPGRDLGHIAAESLAAVTDDVLIATAAEALGAARAVLDETVAYTKVRHQFGQPIGAFQAVQHLCVDMLETVELIRSGVLHALWASASGPSPERHLAAARLKGMSGTLAEVGDTAIQVLGGIGYTWEHDAHLYLRRLLDWSSFLGRPTAYQREIGAALIAEILPHLAQPLGMGVTS
ncbi:acyl-CoA dehydrogenase family protein [Mycobacterium sp. 236(2023)]|uniref:acyl-CoA dehydrogenase family protein n=1 Tax=Mycobacterium sp. 236(2023) TaxID=3038163 RepID=UPI00241511F6|nr:acyl-CoA dehydrogenase family protein [Mycobacterium sp. 236(2023)]MDG4668176.1 acyl-CoA/acyl-ACP dehydrogenase [Mycobacterium sp. 236(2023)]